MSVVARASLVIEGETDEEVDSVLQQVARMNQAKTGGVFLNVIELERVLDEQNEGECSVPGCLKPIRAHGLCSTHEQRRRRGQPVEEIPDRWLPPIVKFWEHVHRSAGEGCWIWTGAIDDKGYGRLRYNGSNGFAHRFAYELLVGPIPDGLELDHVRARGCTHHNCVNPAHLEPVTHAENMHRAQRTHCVHGHAYTPENVYVAPDGGRECRTCKRDRRSNAVELSREAE